MDVFAQALRIVHEIDLTHALGRVWVQIDEHHDPIQRDRTRPAARLNANPGDLVCIWEGSDEDRPSYGRWFGPYCVLSDEEVAAHPGLRPLWRVPDPGPLEGWTWVPGSWTKRSAS